MEQGIELGRAIWNMDNAVWTLQGRHRDKVHFSPYLYNKTLKMPYKMTGLKNGKCVAPN